MRDDLILVAVTAKCEKVSGKWRFPSLCGLPDE